MNIDDLTYGEIKKLQRLFGASGLIEDKQSITSDWIGKYVICRSRNEGINCGKVLAADETGVILDDARRLYYHKPINKNVSWYEGVAKTGISKDSKVGTAVQKLIIEDYSLTLCTAEAEKSLRGAPDNEQA